MASVSNGVISAKKEGTAVISAYMDYQKQRYLKSCVVTVQARIYPELKLSSSSLSMVSGGTVTLKATTVPGNQKVSWSSSNSQVASVADGKVTAHKAGTVTITASMNYEGSTYRQLCTVTVKERTYTGYIKNTVGCPMINRTASTQYPIGSIPECAPCTVYPDRKVGNWVWVSYRGVSGYSYSTYISSTAPASVQKKIYGTSGKLMINRTASTKYPIGSIPEGKYCTVFTSRKVGNWVWVCYNGVYGYAYSKYMK